jgi:hypothetical protein
MHRLHLSTNGYSLHLPSNAACGTWPNTGRTIYVCNKVLRSVKYTGISRPAAVAFYPSDRIVLTYNLVRGRSPSTTQCSQGNSNIQTPKFSVFRNSN